MQKGEENMSEKKILKQYMRKDAILRCMDKIHSGSLKKSAYYGKRTIILGEECQGLIAEKLKSGETFMVARMKADGKQAIRMGGATQILFGIKEKRWDEHPVISKLYNEHWIRLIQTEQTVKQSQIENGCYW